MYPSPGRQACGVDGVTRAELAVSPQLRHTGPSFAVLTGQGRLLTSASFSGSPTLSMFRQASVMIASWPGEHFDGLPWHTPGGRQKTCIVECCVISAGQHALAASQPSVWQRCALGAAVAPSNFLVCRSWRRMKCCPFRNRPGTTKALESCKLGPSTGRHSPVESLAYAAE